MLERYNFCFSQEQMSLFRTISYYHGEELKKRGYLVPLAVIFFSFKWNEYFPIKKLIDTNFIMKELSTSNNEF